LLDTAEQMLYAGGANPHVQQMAKNLSDLGKQKIDMSYNAVVAMSQLAKDAKSQEDWDRVRRMAPLLGGDAANIPAQFTPENQQMIVNQGRSVQQTLEMQQEEYKNRTARMGEETRRQQAQAWQVPPGVVGRPFAFQPLTGQTMPLTVPPSPQGGQAPVVPGAAPGAVPRPVPGAPPGAATVPRMAATQAQINDIRDRYNAATEEDVNRLQGFQTFMNNIRQHTNPGDQAAIASIGRVVQGGRVSNFEMGMLRGMGTLYQQAQGEIQRLLLGTGTLTDPVRKQLIDTVTGMVTPYVDSYLQKRREHAKLGVPLQLTPQEIRDELVPNRYPDFQGMRTYTPEQWRQAKEAAAAKGGTEGQAAIHLLKKGITIPGGPPL
jgi:hypothetical protein